MPDRLVLDIPIVLDTNGKLDFRQTADSVGLWEYNKQQRQIFFSRSFLAPYLRDTRVSQMLFADIFEHDARLHFQNFIQYASANNFAACIAHIKTFSGHQKVLFYSMSQDEHYVRGLCLLIPDSLDISDTKPTHMAESAKYAAIGKMAGSIAHEINNPLSIIRMNAEILLASESLLAEPSKIKEKCHKIVVTTDRISSIVRALRSLSASTQKPQFNWIRFSNLTDDIIELCHPKLSAEAVELKIEADNVARENYFIDYAQITQALINLLNNACDAVRTLPEKWIKIKADTHDDFLHIQVIDSGSGIPKEIVQQLTNELFTTKGTQGLGLGLNLVQAYVSSHGGHLGYRLIDKHTCFYIALPLQIIKPEEPVLSTSGN